MEHEMTTNDEYDLQLYGADFWALDESHADEREEPKVPKGYPMSEHNNLSGGVESKSRTHTESAGDKPCDGLTADRDTVAGRTTGYACESNASPAQTPLQVLFLRRYNDRYSVFSFQLSHSGLDQLWRDNLTLTQTNYAYVISSINPEPLGQSPEGSTDNTTEIN